MDIDSKFYKIFAADMESMGLFFDERKLEAVIKHLGPSIHDADASLVACSDEKETTYIKDVFLVGKLGLDANDPKLDETIHKVCDLMGQSNKRKNRITFYYLLMTLLNVEYTALN